MCITHTNEHTLLPHGQLLICPDTHKHSDKHKYKYKNTNAHWTICITHINTHTTDIRDAEFEIKELLLKCVVFDLYLRKGGTMFSRRVSTFYKGTQSPGRGCV